MSAKLINNANVALEATISKEILESKKKKIVQNIAKNIKIDGFRKGKVPASVVESRYKEKIEQDCEQEAFNDLLKDELKTLNLSVDKVLGTPLVSKFERSESGIVIEAKIGIFPEINIDNYEKSIPKIEIKAVGESEIDARLKELAKQNGNLKEAQKAVELGDTANIDFDGFVDGVAFDGGKSEGFDLEIGSKRFIEGFEEQIVGMKSGEKKDIKVTFPSNYNAAHLAGKEAIFKITLNKVQVREPRAIDDELAKLMIPGNESANLELLRENLKTQLENEAKGEKFSELKMPLADNLLRDIDFDLPDSIIEQEMDMLFRNNLVKIPQDELKELQENQEKAKAKRETFRDDAIKSVKMTFIIDALAKRNNISISDNEMYQMLYYEALMNGQNPKDLIEAYQSRGLLDTIRMALLENKVLNYLLESKVESKSAESSPKKTESKAKDSAKDSSAASKKDSNKKDSKKAESSDK